MFKWFSTVVLVSMFIPTPVFGESLTSVQTKIENLSKQVNSLEQGLIETNKKDGEP
jgi:hypothetical protein